jgi:hypothetical protein
MIGLPYSSDARIHYRTLRLPVSYASSQHIEHFGERPL